MRTELAYSCECGELRGRVSGPRGHRVVCYCLDCQAFAHFLGRTDVLDSHGGSHVYQVSSAEVSFDSPGNLGALCLLPGNKRKTIRFYATCCKSPVGNTTESAGFPFIGLLESGLSADGQSLDRALGPVDCAVGRKDATVDPDELPEHPKFGKRLMLSLMFRVLKRKLAGHARRSPFHDARAGGPSVAVHELTDEEIHSLAPYQRPG